MPTSTRVTRESRTQTIATSAILSVYAAIAPDYMPGLWRASVDRFPVARRPERDGAVIGYAKAGTCASLRATAHVRDRCLSRRGERGRGKGARSTRRCSRRHAPRLFTARSPASRCRIRPFGRAARATFGFVSVASLRDAAGSSTRGTPSISSRRCSHPARHEQARRHVPSGALVDATAGLSGPHLR